MKPKAFRSWLVSLLAVLAVGFALFAGSLLVIDKPQPSDVIVVVSGDVGDVRFQHALKLWRNGYAQELILDAPEWIKYGRNSSDLAREYICSVAGDRVRNIHVCTLIGDSTQLELTEVSSCIHAAV